MALVASRSVFARMLADDSERRLQRVPRQHVEPPNFFDPSSGRPDRHRRLEFCQSILLPCCCQLDISIRLVPDPPCQLKIASEFNDVPPESNTLHASTNLEMDALHSRASV